MKRVIKLFATLALLTGVFGVVATHKEAVVAEAATTETHRVWFGAGTTTWNSNSARTFIYYWTGTGSSKDEPYVWPGVEMKTDDANGLRYFDVAQSNWNIIFVRRNSTNTATWNQTADLLGVGASNFNSKKFIPNAQLNNGTWDSFTPSTTTIVAAFAATIDTAAEACSTEKAQAAVNAYNALSTFEQNQFDVLQVGIAGQYEGLIPGLQRLEWLKTRYGITTPLNANVTFGTDNKNILGITIIGILGVSAIAGYYFLKTKKFI